MRFFLSTAAILAVTALLSFSPAMHGDGTYQVDAAKSKIEWVGKKLTGEHSGNLSLKSGEIVMGGHGITSGHFIIDMTTIDCTDLSGESAEDLEGHLRADDFFGTKKFPTANVKMISASALTGDANGNNFSIVANLTLKDITHEITFPAKVQIGDKQVTVNAQIQFDRTKWGIEYKSKTVFDNLGDKFIYDDIALTVSLTANLK